MTVRVRTIVFLGLIGVFALAYFVGGDAGAIADRVGYVFGLIVGGRDFDLV